MLGKGDFGTFKFVIYREVFQVSEKKSSENDYNKVKKNG